MTVISIAGIVARDLVNRQTNIDVSNGLLERLHWFHGVRPTPPPPLQPRPVLTVVKPVEKPVDKLAIQMRRNKARERIDRAFEMVKEQRDGKLITMTQIIGEVADKHGITEFQLKKRRRERPVVIARQEAMYRCAEETKFSLAAIGRFFGFDHTTVMHAIKAHRARLAEVCM